MLPTSSITSRYK